MQSVAMEMFLEPFKVAAAEGAVVELKLRLLAGSVAALQQSALDRTLGAIELKLTEHFDGFLSADDKETLRLCRELRNKMLHADFHAMRGKLSELGVPAALGNVTKVDIPAVSVAEVKKKIAGVRAGTEGTLVADTASTASGTVFGWFMEMGCAGDFQNAADAFKRAAVIVDRLAGLTDVKKSQ